MVARSIPKNYRNVTGRFASAKNQNLIGFESTLEKDFFLLLEFDHRVESFEEQPVTIAYRGLEGRVCHYTPDALVRYQAALAGKPDWQPVLYEVKYRSDLREHGVEYRPKFKAAKHYACDRGWRFRVVTEREIRTSRLSNIHFLLRYRRIRVDDQDQGCPVGYAAQAGSPQAPYAVSPHVPRFLPIRRDFGRIMALGGYRADRGRSGSVTNPTQRTALRYCGCRSG